MSPYHRDELARARALAAQLQAVPVDRKAWARDVVSRHEAGENFSAVRLREAHLALGLPVPRGRRA